MTVVSEPDDPGDGWTRRRWTWVLVIVGVVALAMVGGAIAAVVAGSGGVGSPAAPSSRTGTRRTGTTIAVTDTACAPGWAAPHTGVQTFRVENRTKQVAEVELTVVDESQERVFAELEAIAPGTTRTVPAVLSRARYAWHCTPTAGADRYSVPHDSVGPPVSGHYFVPVSNSGLLAAILAFQDATTRGITRLVTDTDALRAAADGGSLDQARTAWLTAHLDYGRLGGAYDLFGDYEAKIDGRADGLPGGVDDPSWTGFLKLERLLWNGGSPADIARVADRLDADVHGLEAAFPEPGVPASDLATRVHEILENAIQFELTGQTDEGSHTNLAFARANVDASRTALDAVTPLLQVHSPHLVVVARHDFDHLEALLDPYRRADGSWTPLDALTRTQRQRLDAAFDQTVEDLSTIPDVLEVPKNDSD